MTIHKSIDDILKIINNENGKSIDVSKIKAVIDTKNLAYNDILMLQSVIDKLLNDKFIELAYRQDVNSKTPVYHSNASGLLFLSYGGYVTEYKRRKIRHSKEWFDTYVGRFFATILFLIAVVTFLFNTVYNSKVQIIRCQCNSNNEANNKG